ncbi:MAG: 4a-hydroxytetrahydrobiopterin dehydratase, partial [Pseudomonadota bacterium]
MTERLCDETRGPLLEPLFANGWAMVEGRDAIAKTYVFDSFVDAFGWMT